MEFADRATRELYNGVSSKAARRLVPSAPVQRALDKLTLLDSAVSLEKLRIPPGNKLEAFLQPLGIAQTAFAKHIGVTNARLSEIVHGKRPVTLDSALRFERALGFAAESWIRMQMTVDMYDALHGRTAKAVARIKPIARAS